MRRRRSQPGAVLPVTVPSDDRRPALVRDVELTHPIEPVADTDAARYANLALLVRLHTEPIGMVTLPLPAGGLSAEQVADGVAATLGPRIATRVSGASTLTGAGIQPPARATFVDSRVAMLRDAPSVTVAVCTRDQPDGLRRCLQSLAALEYPRFDVLVVDNASAPEASAAARELVAALADRVDAKYVREDTPGLSWARNTAVEHAAGQVVAFTDDDVVVDRHWLAELARGFRAAPHVDCVSGLVVPAQLETQAQTWFEDYGGHSKGRGFQVQVFGPGHDRQDPMFPLPPFGVGANMAFRREALARIGGFETALGAGAPAMGSEDTLAFTEVLLSGGTIVYQPTAVVRHVHRPDPESLRRQLYGYGVGLGAYYTHLVLEDPRRLVALARLAPRAVREMKAGGETRTADVPAGFPPDLLSQTRRGLLRGPGRYLRGRRAARRVGRRLTAGGPEAHL